MTTSDTFTASSKTHSNYPNNARKAPTGNFIAFWNGAYNSSNSSNLTYAHQGTIQCKPKVLWTNSNITTFNAQTVSISGLSDYAFIDILYVPFYPGNANLIKVERHYYDATRKNGSMSDVFWYSGARYYGVREYTVNSGGIYFGDSHNDNGGTDNRWYVPWKVIGYK